ncbi:hypothetical protein Afer_0326 [Acidimicrobium ferrooxidans DSM 10331]|uniref:Uncharacterized protein n=1 Tax=Acidimicrobium ferrooxidans (strain DSM 10331 / JCM 15462 / NBRC 103882 / ICP) TaxID=525909 RepID=C7M2Q0_ACIFD|nr:hypothetical protein [Acidimicrobium ferrooxidans]ACU53294.1 hypothetical protein Afer_0326 [Acidimicrobium ferrooxidans DSM 10331]
MSEPSFWETLERVAALVDGPPVVRPQLVTLVGGDGAVDDVASAASRGGLVPSPVEHGDATVPSDDGAPRGAGEADVADAVAASAVAPPSPAEDQAGARPGTPVARADAVFQVLEQTQRAEVVAEFGRRDAGAAPAELTTASTTPATWDDVDEGVVAAPSGFLAGLAAKHRIFAETGEIDVDLDRVDRRKRRRRGRSA